MQLTPREEPAPDPEGGSLRSNWGPLAFVWGIWAVLLWKLIDMVLTFGVDFPYYDEWEMIPTLTGAQPVTLRWLWSQHNEHRIFLPRLVYLAVEKVGRYDFRAGMYFDVLALSAAAAVLILLARRARGRTEYADAFLPLVLMNGGQAQNIINSFQVAFVSGTVLSVAVLSLSTLRQIGFRQAVGLGVCTALMPLLGGHGLALVPALSVVVVITGWSLRREPGGTWKMLVVWALAGVAIALMAFYFVGYARPAKHPLSSDPAAILNAAVQFLTVGLGSATRMMWPDAAVPFFAVSVASLGALIWVVWRRPEKRQRAIRLLLFLAAMGTLALGISRSRTALGTEALFASRYAALAAPFWCAIFFAWELVDRPKIRRFAQTALLFCAAAIAAANRLDGAREAIFFRDVRQLVVNDIKAGVKLVDLVNRHYTRMYYGDRGALMDRMRVLHAMKVGWFAQLKE
jgi:hypothetical protein